MHENYVYSMSRIAELGPGRASERVGPWLLVDAGLGISEFNVGVVVGEVPDAAKALLGAKAWYARRGLNMRLDLRSDEDAELIAEAALEGLRHQWSEPAMLLHPLPEAPKLPEGLVVTEVRDEATLQAYAGADLEEYGDTAFQLAMARTATGMAGCTLVLGTMDGVAVARSMGVVTGDMVGVHNVYVPPSQRGRGYGAALTSAAIERGRGQGAVAACLEASQLGYRVYERLGFRTLREYIVLGE